MPNGSEQASAYLSEAETTLQSARVLAEDDPDTFASQIVKNAYDAVGTGAFGRRRSAWRGRSATTRREDPALLRAARRPRAGRDGVRLALAPEQRTVRRFQGSELSVPSKNFDRDGAEQILADTEKLLEFVRERMDDEA